MRGSHILRIGSIAGIPVGIHPLWLLVVGLITWALGADYFPDRDPGIGTGAAYALGLASALLLFASILLHEVGHAVVARRRGVGVEEIDLWLLGGVARMSGEPKRAEDELRYAAAGPAVTLLVVVAFAGVRLAVGHAPPAWARALLDYQVYVNAVILGFNLVPAFPLDGGRLLRALLWRRSGDIVRATAAAATIGRAFGVMIAALGMLSVASGVPDGLWFVVVGLFIFAAARAEAQASELRSAFAGLRVGDIMSAPAICVPRDTPLAIAVDRYFAHYIFTAFPVVGLYGEAQGLLTIEQVRSTPRDRRDDLVVADVADHDRALVVDPSAPVEELLGRPAFLRVGRAVVADASGTVVGLVSVTDLERRRRVAALSRSAGDRPEVAAGAERVAMRSVQSHPLTTGQQR